MCLYMCMYVHICICNIAPEAKFFNTLAIAHGLHLRHETRGMKHGIQWDRAGPLAELHGLSRDDN